MKIGVSLFISILFLTSLTLPAQAKRGPNIQLTPLLTNELNTVLENTEQLQQTFFHRLEVDVKPTVHKLMMSLERAKSYSTSEVSISDRQHLLRLLDAAEQKLSRLLATKGESRRKHLQEVFETLAHLPRIYSLDSKFKIFFCNRDRSSWIQSVRNPRNAQNPQNPIHPETMGNCGSTVQ